MIIKQCCLLALWRYFGTVALGTRQMALTARLCRDEISLDGWLLSHESDTIELFILYYIAVHVSAQLISISYYWLNLSFVNIKYLDLYILFFLNSKSCPSHPIFLGENKQFVLDVLTLIRFVWLHLLPKREKHQQQQQ